MILKTAWLTLAIVLGCVLADKVSYEGYKLYDILIDNQEQADLIAQLEHNPDFDLWSRIRAGTLKVLLAPTVFEKYETLFKLFKIKFEIAHHNIQEVFDEEQRQMSKRDLSDGRSIAGKFARYNEIQNFIEELVEGNPGLVSSYVTGTTPRGEILKVAVFKTANSKRKAWLDCGIHAREWIAVSTCVWVMDKLVKEYNAGVQSTVDLLNYYEIHILPVVNPDGYEYSHKTDRMWRKNRANTSNPTCVGVDLNRNFGFQWLTGGSSTLPCSSTYAGPSANSELETRAVQAAINAYPNQWDAFLTVHTYGKWLFTPYGYTANILPPDFAELDATAKVAVNALQAVYKETGWITGSSAKILYIASGGSEDWSYGVAKIKYSYCFELRPGQTGPDSGLGFELTEDKAPLAGEETYVGIKALLNDIIKNTNSKQ